MNANKVIQQVADMYGVTVEAVLSPCRRRELADCRTVICYILVTRHKISKSETGRIIHRKHADVIHHVTKGGDWLGRPLLNPEGHKAIKTMLTQKPP